MIGVIETITGTLGISFEYVIMIILGVSSMVFAARSMLVWLLVTFLLSAGLTMWFYAAGLNYAPPLGAMFFCIGVLCLSLYLTSKSTSSYAGLI